MTLYYWNFASFYHESRACVVVRTCHDGRPTVCARDRSPSRRQNGCTGLPGEQNCKCGAATCDLDHILNLTSRKHFGETEQRRHSENGGSICVVTERRCRHNMMNTTHIHIYLRRQHPYHCDKFYQADYFKCS